MRTDRRGEEGVVIRERELLLNSSEVEKKGFQQFSESGLGPCRVVAQVHPVSKPSADHADAVVRGGEGLAGVRSDVAFTDRLLCVFRNQKERFK